jgi:hypothetical protein
VLTLAKGDIVDIAAQDSDAPVYLLLNGKVILQNHSLDDPFEAQTLQVTKPGMFIGVKSLDQGQSVLPLCFAVVYSDQAHLLKMSPEAASKMWF